MLFCIRKHSGTLWEIELAASMVAKYFAESYEECNVISVYN